jgi:hypothetical protein
MRSVKDYLKVIQRILSGRFCISKGTQFSNTVDAFCKWLTGSFRGIYGKCGIGIAPEKRNITFVM